MNPRRKDQQDSALLDSGVWEKLYRDFQAPLFVEDVSEVLKALAAIKAQGVADLGAWLDARPEFITRTLSMVKVLDVNDFAIEWSGAASKEELLGSLERMILPETLPALKQILIDLFEGKRHYQSEAVYQTLAGRQAATINNGLLPHPDDDPALLLLALTEITGLKSSQRELAASQERYRRLVEAAQDVILSHSLSGEIAYVNQVGVDLTGWSRERLIGQDLSFLLPDRKPGENRASSLKVLSETRGRSLYEARMSTRDGKEIPVEVSSTVMPGIQHSDGEPLMLAMIRDITERREAEEKQRQLEEHLRHNQKLESLGMLAGGIAHDFNNLLVTIMGHTELLLGGKQRKEEVKNALGVIMEASTQAADLCRQMQAYAGQTVPHLEQENLGSILENMSRLLQVTVSGKAHLDFQFEPDLPRVKVDAGQIRQVVMSLVANAADSVGARDGEIMIRTRLQSFANRDLAQWHRIEDFPPGEYVVCEVEDNGSGMNQEVRQRLFDPFFTTKPGSRGLGMSSALGIIQGHQGAILVHSSPGKGTRVQLLLPALSQAARGRARARQGKKAPDDLHKVFKDRTILTVDEDSAVRGVGEGFLRRLGCKVLSAGNGPDAVRVFSDRQQDIDLVLLDLTMEGMDGVETCRRLRALRPDLPVVFVSGFSSEEVDRRAADFAPYGFVPKPFRLVQMRAILAEVLAAHFK